MFIYGVLHNDTPGKHSDGLISCQLKGERGLQYILQARKHTQHLARTNCERVVVTQLTDVPSVARIRPVQWLGIRQCNLEKEHVYLPGSVPF